MGSLPLPHWRVVVAAGGAGVAAREEEKDAERLGRVKTAPRPLTRSHRERRCDGRRERRQGMARMKSVVVRARLKRQRGQKTPILAA